ncbi:uncharacterized protein LOC133195683 [Saccostrea echinata]|uniref:uncharacterized protein LOC133195683 n=1 Tax=Saccostrea echinata TaxID=191078 RepID=UPI002A8167D9|nr:uncharacterized protein LOC133195683 [Saccostrea echinata]
MHWEPFLVVLLIFIINEGASFSEKIDDDNGVLTSALNDEFKFKFKRDREKRRILDYRQQEASDHGGGYSGHNLNIPDWQNGLERIQDSQARYHQYIDHDEFKKRNKQGKPPKQQ